MTYTYYWARFNDGSIEPVQHVVGGGFDDFYICGCDEPIGYFTYKPREGYRGSYIVELISEIKYG